MLAIIGAGPGGYTAALAAAQRGVDTTLIEKRDVGGTCLNRGCIPTKALLSSSHLFEKIKKSESFGIYAENITADIAKIHERKNNVVNTLRSSLESLIKKRKIRLIKAEGKIINPNKILAGNEEITCDSIIIATGSSPLKLWNDPSVIDSDEALTINEIPKTMLIVGAGAVGLEFANFFNAMGCKTTLAETQDRILPSADKDITDTLTRELKKKGVIIKTKTQIVSVKDGEAIFSNGTASRYDKILSAAGRTFNNTDIGLQNLNVSLSKGRIKTNLSMETSEKGVYAIGDAADGFPLLAHVASAQAIVAVKNILGEKTEFKGDAIPSCIFSYPETASVGIAEGEGLQAIKIPFRSLGRSHTEGEIAGLVKIVYKDNIVKGVHIIGERASDLIIEGAAAVSEGMSVKTLAQIIHAHPTYAEIYQEAYHAIEGIPIHG